MWGGRERRVAMWLQGLTILVIAAWVSMIFRPEITWPAIAALTGSHTLMYVLLNVMNGHRWRLEDRRQALEQKFSGGV